MPSESENAFPQQLQAWLQSAVDVDASDLHLVPGNVPVVRIHGQLTPLGSDKVDPDSLQTMLTCICSADVLAKFERQLDVDFSFTLKVNDVSRRFRANLFVAQQQSAACFRIIPAEIPNFDWAGFPRRIAHRLVGFRNGLVLITGVTGAGKTTTLAMLINQLIDLGNSRIITIEEPIEYVFPAIEGSVISQREVGRDVQSFSDGLKFGLRQDPDVILVGEIRDRETAQMALTAAETGHLVFSTLHTRDAKGAISRYTDLFPQSVQAEIRSQLAMSLRAIISQHLLAGTDPNQKRELALEILFNTMPIAAAVRAGKLQSIENCIVTGRGDGMITLEESVRLLYASDRISHETAMHYMADGSVLGR